MSHSFFDEVIRGDPRLLVAVRVSDPSLLEPATRSAVSAILSDASALGIPLMVYETYRSQARQEMLFRAGVTRLEKVGVHHYGLAADLVRCLDGEPSWKGDFSFLGELARKHGLIWGGDWGDPDVRHSFVDVFHLQRCSLKREPSLFAGEWYPDASDNPYQD